MMNEEDDEAEGSRRSLPTKQIKISISLSFHDIFLLCICLDSIDVLCMIECVISRVVSPVNFLNFLLSFGFYGFNFVLFIFYF